MSRPGVSVEASREGQERHGHLSGRLGRMPLKKQVLTLAMWPFLEQVLGFVVATVDLVLAAGLGEGDTRLAMMDAMGMGGYLGWFLMIFQGAVGTGVMALVSRETGARNYQVARAGTLQGILLGAMVGLFVVLFVKMLLPTLLGAFNLTEAAVGFAMEYIGVMVWSAPILGVLLALNNALRGSGDTRTPFTAMIVVNIVNVAMSLLFVSELPGVGGRGMQGLALGTVLGWLAGVIFLLVTIWLRREKEDDEARLILRGLPVRFDKGLMARIARVGIPQALEMGGMWTIQMVMLRAIASLPGSGVVGAHFLAIRVESMSFLPGFAIGSAGATLVGQYLGAKNPEMAVRSVRYCWRYALIFMGILGIVFLLIPDRLVGLIVVDGSDAEHFQRLAVPLVFLCGLTQPFLATTLIMKTTMRGAGATYQVMVVSFAIMLFFRVFLIPVGVVKFGLTLQGVWIVMACDVFTQSIVFTVLHFRGYWLRARV